MLQAADQATAEQSREGTQACAARGSTVSHARSLIGPIVAQDPTLLRLAWWLGERLLLVSTGIALQPHGFVGTDLERAELEKRIFDNLVALSLQDDKKTPHLRTLNSKVPIFKDVGHMGGRVAEGVA